MSGLRVACLPAVAVERDGRPVAGFRSVAERALLVYLAVEGGGPTTGRPWPGCCGRTPRPRWPGAT